MLINTIDEQWIVNIPAMFMNTIDEHWIVNTCYVMTLLMNSE